MYADFEAEQRFEEAWRAVDIVRPVNYSLFTFGESVLPYYVVCGERDDALTVSVTQGDVRINRPMVITPDSDHPQFQNFFENQQEEGVAQFLLARSARFSNLKFENRSGNKRTVQSDMGETINRLNRKLDDEEEDRVAVLSAPPSLGNIAVLRYAMERVWESAPGNVQELRERGFLP